MFPARISPQQLDPLAGVTAQAFAWVFAIGAFATATGLTLVHRAEYHDMPLLLGAFVALAAAVLVVILASSPRRAPFTWRAATAIHLLCLSAVALEAAAQWGTNTAVRSDWGPLVLALLVMATGCFRPALEILAMTAVSAAFVATTTIAGAFASDSMLPPLVYAALTAGPILAAGVGAAVFSATLVSRLLHWRDATHGARLVAVERMRVRVRDDLRDERLTMIEDEVGPFLRELLARGTTDASTAASARQFADELRRALVDEADGVWLDGVVAELHDTGGLATRMDGTQRAAVEAACTALADRRTRATLERAGRRIRLVLVWERDGRGRLGPELQAMLRHVFPGARLQLRARRVELEFDAA